MSIMEELGRNIIQTQFDTFDRDVIDRAKDRIIDTLGCIFTGVDYPAYRMIIDLEEEWGGKEESTIIGRGTKVPAQNAALANSVMATAAAFDAAFPIIDGKRYLIHMSGTTIPVALAVAEQKGTGGKELITALLLGDDLTARIAAASQQTPTYGWDSGSTMLFFGATAIAGKLLGLNEYQLLNAFGIALHQIAGTKQSMRDLSHGFKLGQGLAARGGIFSAELAARGVKGVQDPLLSRFGYFALYCQTFSTEALTKDLGRFFYADTTFKRYPCCSENTAAVDCILELVHQHTLRPGEIDEVIVRVPQTMTQSLVVQPFAMGEVPAMSAAYSMAYVLSSILLRKDIRVEHFYDDSIGDPEILDFIKKVKIGFLSGDEPIEADIKVRMKSGREFSETVDVASIDPVRKGLTRAEIRDKFRKNAASSRKMSTEKIERVLSTLEGLEHVRDVRDIIRLIN